MKKWTILAVYLFGCLMIAAAQTSFPKNDLDEVIGQLVGAHQIPSASVLITNGDSVVYSFCTPKTGINDLFLIGSNSKSFTALAILQLATNGLIDIDKPVADYLGWFAYANESTTQKITVRHLLNQTSGIPATAGFQDFETGDFEVFQKNYGHFLSKTEPACAIGGAFNYSNSNYVLLGLIVQKVTGEPYKKYVSGHIFQPIGMKKSFADFQQAVANQLVTGYQMAFFSPVEAKTRPFSDFLVPEGHIASTAADMGLYLRAMLKKSAALGISDTFYRQMIEPKLEGYAMGWGETRYFDQPIVQHLGLNENFNSAMFFMPKQDFGVVALANTNSPEFGPAVKEAIILTLLGKQVEEKPSGEKMQRIATFITVLLALILFVFNLGKWRKQGFKTEKISFIGILRCVLGVLLSWLPAFFVPKMHGIPIGAMAGHQPDFAFGFIAIGLFGTLSALVRLLRKK